MFDSGHDVNKGTAPANDMTGNLGEVLVAAIVWDLMDPVGGTEEPEDQIAASNQVLASLTRHLPRKDLPTRGKPGVDLVDFLDGWRCQSSPPDS